MVGRGGVRARRRGDGGRASRVGVQVNEATLSLIELRYQIQRHRQAHDVPTDETWRAVLLALAELSMLREEKAARG